MLKDICSKCKSPNDSVKHYWCKACKKSYNKIRKLNNREKLNAQKLKWQTINQKARRYGQVKSRHRMTVEHYERLLLEQGYVCAICKNPEKAKTKTKGTKSLAIDHCHVTGKIRGLLCQKCNMSLGLLNENFDSILSMAKYVQIHNNVI